VHEALDGCRAGNRGPRAAVHTDLPAVDDRDVRLHCRGGRVLVGDVAVRVWTTEGAGRSLEAAVTEVVGHRIQRRPDAHLVADDVGGVDLTGLVAGIGPDELVEDGQVDQGPT